MENVIQFAGKPFRKRVGEPVELFIKTIDMAVHGEQVYEQLDDGSWLNRWGFVADDGHYAHEILTTEQVLYTLGCDATYFIGIGRLDAIGG